VYSFEATPQTSAALKTNSGLNHFANVEARSLAVCERTGSINLFLAPHENSGRNSLIDAGGRQTLEVPCIRLDNLG
jgi:FkbM family methyltransferase